MKIKINKKLVLFTSILILLPSLVGCVLWTLENDENWRKTHRLAGKIWVLGGLLLFLNSFVQLYVYWVFFLTLFFVVIIPSVYSYQLSKLES